MARDGAFDDRFKAALEAAGLRLTADEAAGVEKLAAWMHDGLAAQEHPQGLARPDEAICDLDIFALGARLREGRLSALELTRATLARIAARDPVYLSFYRVLEESALAEAAQADSELAEGLDRGPLHGIPVGIKDLIDVAGVPTTANAPGRADVTAKNDAEVVHRLREAGAIIIGKLATYEWATVGPDKNGLFPPARNPWNPEHITGGSSSGCAAAVAGGLIRTSIGTDTGGSVRGPSFYCGTVGLKPTYGTVSTHGVLDLAPSLDHVGTVSATVAEAALTLDVLGGRVGQQAACSRIGEALSGLRVGYARNWFVHDPQAMPEVAAAIDTAISVLSQLGAVVNEVEMPDYAGVEVAVAAILHAESFRLHADGLRDNPEAYGRRAYLSLAAGLALTDAEVTRARDAGEAFRATVDGLLDRHDVLITVGALTTALPVAPFEKEAVWTPMRTIGFNVSGHPVLAVPIGFHQGLPIGMQIIGRHHDEARIVQVGHAYERATDTSLQRPPVPR
ncbi:amidase [uncultured Devosia sp.]|uniref:amidase n=1 Tax=uncultured Devosia sp. TaxID=211434 RepID=UPI002608BF39|nr:amidase [uncultured Devosia sp.]